MSEFLRMFVALAVVGLLGRAARPAWYHRRLAFAVWRRIRVRHIAGCVALLAAVLTTALGLMAAVPLTSWGLGRLVGLDGNAVFAPLQEAVEYSGDQGVGAGGVPLGPDWALLATVTIFLALLLALFPWLAYVEERVFRQGLEEADLPRQLAVAARFGAIHLVMLIPVAAAVGVGVAGFAYGRIYRSAFRRARGAPPEPLSWFTATDIIETPARRARTEAVMAATVWHTTFNSLIVLLVLVSFVAAAL